MYYDIVYVAVDVVIIVTIITFVIVNVISF